MLAFSGSLLLTFRELWALRLTQGMFAVATLAWVVLSLALTLDVVEGSLAALRIFGMDAQPGGPMPIGNFVLAINQLVFGATYFVGTLLGLFATMPLIGGLLESGRIDLLLSKPVSRSRILGGHLAGLVLIVLALSTYLIGGVWLTLALKTGVWEVSFLAAIPMTVTMFVVMYGVLLLFTVLTRNAGLGLIVSYGLIFVSVILAAHEQIRPQLDGIGLAVFSTLYHVLPNFAEIARMVSQLASPEGVSDTYPFVSSLLFGATVYAFCFGLFARKDF
jgi:ABC-type transport system involved in multi-copper enzyme maturation permease subunit